jgi:hypothetical protein
MNREQIKPNHYHGEIEAWWTPKYCFMCRAVKAVLADLAEKVRGLQRYTLDLDKHDAGMVVLHKDLLSLIEGEK